MGLLHAIGEFFPAILVLIITWWLYQISNKIADKPNFPDVYIDKVQLDLQKVKVFKGKKVPPKDFPSSSLLTDNQFGAIWDSPGSNEVKFIETCKDDSGNIHPFALVNFCGEKPKRDYVVLVLHALEIVFSLENVTHLDTKKAFSARLQSGGSDYNTFDDCKYISLSSQIHTKERAKLNGYSFFQPQSQNNVTYHPLCLAYAYTYDGVSTTSLNLSEIVKAANEVTNNRVLDFLIKDAGEAGKYLNFTDTGYLLNLTTNKGDEYKYSAYMRVADDRLVEARVVKGSNLFNRKANLIRVNIFRRMFRNMWNEICKSEKQWQKDGWMYSVCLWRRSWKAIAKLKRLVIRARKWKVI